MFAGERIAWFAGVEYLTPLSGVRLKVELDGNDYTNEPAGGDAFFASQTPFNFGIEYRPFSWITAGITYERGNQLAARLAITARLNDTLGLPKISDDPKPPISVRPAAPSNTIEPPLSIVSEFDSAEQLTNTIFDAFDSRGMNIDEIATDVSQLQIVLDGKTEPPTGQVSSAAFEILRVLPASYSGLAVMQSGISSVSQRLLVLSRADLYAASSIQSLDKIDDHYWASLKVQLAAEGINVIALEQSGNELTIYFSQSRHRFLPRAIGRAVRIASGAAPVGIELFTFVHLTNGVTTASVSMLRRDFERVARHRGSAEEIWSRATFNEPNGIPGSAKIESGLYPSFNWYVTPKVRQHIGRPGQFHRYQIWLKLASETELVRGLFLDTVLGANVYNNFDDLESVPDSRLRHVRSEIVNYLNKGSNSMVQLSLSHITNPLPGLFTKVSAGYLEEMFAGFGGEILYHPSNSRIAVGLEIYKVYQREFEQRFGLLNEEDLAYQTNTGHLSVYYDAPGQEISGQISIGRYLAEDIGGTLLVGRLFQSGIRVGGWLTLTDLAPEEFGEGSFDKGVFITVPYDLFFTRSTSRAGTFAFRPLTRDGGQRVNVPRPLIGASSANNGTMTRYPHTLLD